MTNGRKKVKDWKRDGKGYLGTDSNKNNKNLLLLLYIDVLMKTKEYRGIVESTRDWKSVRMLSCLSFVVT